MKTLRLFFIVLWWLDSIPPRQAFHTFSIYSLVRFINNSLSLTSPQSYVLDLTAILTIAARVCSFFFFLHEQINQLSRDAQVEGGSCCLSARPLQYSWLDKNNPPWQHTRGGHDGADGNSLTCFPCPCQTDNATGVTRCPSWIKAQTQVFPSSLAAQFSPSSAFSLRRPHPISLPLSSFSPLLTSSQRSVGYVHRPGEGKSTAAKEKADISVSLGRGGGAVQVAAPVGNSQLLTGSMENKRRDDVALMRFQASMKSWPKKRGCCHGKTPETKKLFRR